MSTDVQRLMAEGTEVTFVDDSQATLRFNARALAKLEDHYGSLDGFLEEIRKASGGKVYHLIVKALSVALGLPEERVWNLIDTTQALKYLTAISVAVAEALPQPEAEDKLAGNGQAAPADEFLGAASTIAPSSSGASTPSDFGI